MTMQNNSFDSSFDPSVRFDEQAFGVFGVDGLDPRMEAIRAHVWPPFEQYAGAISAHVQEALGLSAPLFVHVAKHARRSVYAPESTWVAVGGDKRGYKKYPHFQIGINDEYVFVALACIDNPLHEAEIAHAFAGFRALPSGLVLIPSHLEKAYVPAESVDRGQFFSRVASVKKAEFMLGSVAEQGSAQLSTASGTWEWMRAVVDELLPWYELAMSFYEE
ncbi:DUF1054 family protein [Alloscardovia macacae]|uniref:Uncharacterized protein n=1 Tax=Alloscardovia macacae TaxID=1160091 RepID=A0A261F1V4_9BIFI|nr:DUF1054 family protein [Alloscardovia macacae]OZG53078.1 hypothetical protein ALMA_1380 [Alloscardovia macacae]